MWQKFQPFIRSIYFIATIVVLCVFSWIMWKPGFSFYIPWCYKGDGIFASVMIKSLINTGSFWTNSNLGFPGGYELYDFPANEFSNFLIMYIESLFTDNYAVVLNVFYFLCFFFITYTSLYTCKRIGLSNPFALLVSVIFAFAPHHFYRGEPHLFLSAYYAVPIYFLMAISFLRKDKLEKFFSHKRQTYLTWSYIIVLMLVIFFFTSSGIYYAFFGSFFILIGAIYVLTFKREWSVVLRLGFFIGCIALAAFFNILPSLVYKMHYGANLQVAGRLPLEAEYNGLKIVLMLLPTPFSGFSFLHDLFEKYQATAPLVVGNNVVSLGILGSIGFLLLLFFSLFHKSILFFKKEVREKIELLGTFNLSAILLATIGGFGALFAYTISPMIRAYNRINIFIMYFSLIALAFFLQFLIGKLSEKRASLYSWVIIGLLLVFGVYDQIGGDNIYQEDYQYIEKKFNSDEEFVKKIENSFSNNLGIFQLPYASFPERAPINKMLAYDEFRGYLHSQHLKWGAGATKGRSIGLWEEAVSVKPLPELLQNIVLAGFGGLYIDRNGYADEGQAIEAQLKSLLNIQPLESSNKDLLFFDLRSYTRKFFAQYSAAELQYKKAFARIHLDWGKGFWELETTGRWSYKKSTLILINPSNNSLKVKLSFKLITVGSNFSNVYIKTPAEMQNYLVNEQGKDVVLPVLLHPGKNKIYFSTNAPRVEAPTDARQMYLRVNDFNISENTRNSFRTSSAKREVKLNDAISSLKPLEINKEVLLSASESKINLVNGWSVIESWGVWTDAKSAIFAISSKNLPKKFQILLKYQGFVTASHPQQFFEFFNEKGNLIQKADFKYGSDKKVVILNIDRSKDQYLNTSELKIVVKIRNPITPKDAGLSEGDRRLGLGLYSLKIHANK